MKIYLASSWKNPRYPETLAAIRSLGHEVYDFRNPEPGNTGFQWTEIDHGWRHWSALSFREALKHPIAEKQFKFDALALEECDLCILLLPCGRSAHLEAGYAIGKAIPTIILLTNNDEPELMYKFASKICVSLSELLEVLKDGGRP